MASRPTSEVPGSPFRSTRTTPEEKQEKRAALLAAAVRMFNDRGYHATSLEDVAASLGVTKPVIYHHLGNKEQVLFECVRLGLHELQAAAEQAKRGPGSGLAQLKLFLRRYAEVIMDDFGRCVIRTGDELLSPESRADFRALKRGINDALHEMIARAMADGSARVEDVGTTALALAGGLNWAARWYNPDGPLSPQEMAERLVEALCAGIRPLSHNDCARSGT